MSSIRKPVQSLEIKLKCGYFISMLKNNYLAELDASLNTNTKRLFLVKRAVLFLEDAGLPVSIHVLHAGLYVQLH